MLKTIGNISKTVRKLSYKMKTLESLRFDNQTLRRLPLDPEKRNYVRTVNGACFSKVEPTPLKNPKLVASSLSALSLIDLNLEEVNRGEFVEYFSGNKLLPGCETAAHCYCGHQFGTFAGQLGDGAAMYLGEILNDLGERWEIQLKGSGLTPYSRTADGRKVLRSSIREFLCSEAMHYLGIPTTRAGCCITSDTTVLRDIYYDGNPTEEKCSVVLRIAPTFLRFGSFEIFKLRDPMSGRMGPSFGRNDILQTLLDFAIEIYYPQIHASCEDKVERYARFFNEVVIRTAKLIAQWNCVGFVHGVMNTDNMSILGLTIDYGPFGFMDIYDPKYVSNATDERLYYCYERQMQAGLFNLLKLAEVLQMACPIERLKESLKMYEKTYWETYLCKMRAKLGIISSECDEDKELISDLMNTMEKTASDFTNTFLSLMRLDLSDQNSLQRSSKITQDKLLDNCYPLETMLKAWKPSLNERQCDALKNIIASNFEIACNSSDGFLRILKQMERYESAKEMTSDEKIENDKRLWSAWLEKYILRIKEDLKKFSGDPKTYQEERVKVMQNSNPRFILRNHIAQEAIEKAEEGDFTLVQKLVEIVQNPYKHTYSEAILNSETLGETEVYDRLPIEKPLLRLT